MSAERPFLKKGFAELVADLLEELGSGRGGRAALTDTTEGSVLRTLVEAFSREIAVAYEQLETVYETGYLDTAQGPALDKVVLLAGLTRRRGGHLEGLVRFARGTPAPGNIAVPAGTLVTGAEAPAFETTENATLREGETQVLVTVRSVEPGEEAVPGDAVNLIATPIAGIETISGQSAAFTPESAEETDEELRERARYALRRRRASTLEGIRSAVAALGLEDVRVVDHRDQRGVIKVLIGDPDLPAARVDEIRQTVEEVRPAGIRADVVVAGRVVVGIRATLMLERDPEPGEEAAIQGEIRDAIAAYFAALQVNQGVRLPKVQNLLLDHPKVVGIADEPFAPFLNEDGQPFGDSLAPNGDLIIESNERAVLGHVDLILQPPVFEVWVDVRLHLKPDVPADALDAELDEIEEMYRTTIAEEGDRAFGAARAFRFSEFPTLRTEGRTKVERLSFRAIHQSDGQVSVLNDANDVLELGSAERMTLRALRVVEAEGSDG